MANKFELFIVTPKGNYFQGQVEEVVVGGIAGPLGIMNNHIDTIVPLVPFNTHYFIDGNKKVLFTSYGVLKVERGKVTVVVEACESPEEIDINRAKAAEERAKGRIKQKEGVDTKRAEAALQRSMMRLRVKDTNL